MDYSTSPFMLDGVHVKPPHIGPQLYEWERISMSFNDGWGNFNDVTLAQKDKFFWEYTYITAAEMKVIEDIVKPKISVGRNQFNITSWTPDRGFVTKLCYLGAPISYKVLASHDGLPSAFAVGYHWIQIEGHKEL